ALGAGVADGAGFRHPVMIDDSPAGPEFFDSSLCGLDTAAGLAGDDDSPDLRIRNVDSLFNCSLAEVKRVGRCAAQHGDFVIENRAEPSAATHPATGDCKTSHACRCVECNPESKKRPEREREEDPVAGA